MRRSRGARAVRSGSALAILILLSVALTAQSTSTVVAPPHIEANSNRAPAGTLENGVLTLHLELRQADWYPEADTGPSIKVYAFAEEGKSPQVPAPLIRVPQGTQIRVTLRNSLPAAVVVHGLHQHPGDASDVLQVPAGEIREVRFASGVAGTYQYWATAGGQTNRGRPFKEDSQLAGAFVVDPPGSVAADRVFVIGVWRSQISPVHSQDVPVINGKSWPYTERLTYAAGEGVRWRWINASDLLHPMHLHGSYYRVDSVGDGERDQIFDPAQQQMVVTHGLVQGATMTTFWTPVAGRWLFHCHLIAHMMPEMNLTNVLAGKTERIHEHGPDHMAGLVMGITVTGDRPAIVSHGSTRKLRLLVRERPAHDGSPAGYSYQIEESHKLNPEVAGIPGPPLILERGRPVEINVVNQLHEPTAVHWHGIELESYYDGVVGWGASGKKITPAIDPGQSFQVRFTPPRAGTFIYHTHMNDEAQMFGGLYGPLIVLEPGTRFDPLTDKIFMLSREGGDEATASRLLNGSANPPTLKWRKGQRNRLRLINITPNNPAVVSLKSPAGLVQWRAIAKDGADVTAAQAVMQSSQTWLWTGETYDFEFEPQEAGSLSLEFENNPSAALAWKVVQTIEIE